MLVLTSGADIQIPCTQPVLGTTAFLTDETIGPLLPEQIIVTGFRIGKARIKFDFVIREIFCDWGRKRDGQKEGRLCFYVNPSA